MAAPALASITSRAYSDGKMTHTYKIAMKLGSVYQINVEWDF